mmetsp:Transcript_5693/g.12920  ORF Transcript_5693/g.12920 Transcript_5693/m.12920 type:complete len:212 (-) Transcript_5693:44-679(-)
MQSQLDKNDDKDKSKSIHNFGNISTVPKNSKKTPPASSQNKGLGVSCKNDTQAAAKDSLAKKIDQPLPGIESNPSKNDMQMQVSAKDILPIKTDHPSASKSTLVASKARLTVLISNGVCDYIQAANQKATLNLLGDLCISYDIIDGMDPVQRVEREKFFGISGIRGNYPQLFFSAKDNDDTNADADTHTYLGGYDWLYGRKIEYLNTLSSK